MLNISRMASPGKVTSKTRRILFVDEYRAAVSDVSGSRSDERNPNV